MSAIGTAAQPVLLNPDLAVADPAAGWWLAQVTLRLRREVAWCWHLRGDGRPVEEGVLPPFSDAALDSLDLARHAAAKRRFFAGDVAARYLGERLDQLGPVPAHEHGWSALARRAGLDPAAELVLALALAWRLDAALGPVLACCQNDATRPWPTLGLAQRLWEAPRAVAACADPGHPLQRFGLLGRAGLADWLQPLEMPPALAHALAEPDAPSPSLQPVEPDGRTLPAAASGLVARLAPAPLALQLVPLLGERGADQAGWAAALSTALGRRLVRLAPGVPASGPELAGLLALCWLRELDLLLPAPAADGHGHEPWYAGLLGIPVRCYLPAGDGAALATPAEHTTPAFALPRLGYAERRERLEAALGTRAPAVAPAIREAARAFRLGELPLRRVAEAIAARPGPIAAEALHALCRAEAGGPIGGLAQPVEPRFSLDELVLPPRSARQLQEIVRAMRALARVHHDWGTARAWNESGLSVLFAGASGTGKTMAAEALAAALELPLYRIDLSQVVNKYIGETEKNLARIFDAAEAADTILFFDEADALFGKRTEVKDAHDRFANIEVSYLLERMERFKGLAVLATNRRKDLDDAFLRRLRYIVDFPLPGPAERERIWRQCFPAAIDVRAVDFPFLAARFELAGGNIRSAAFNACLQSAAEGGDARVTMPAVLTAIRRELGKLDRLAEPEQFGAYAALLEEA
jgi:hypothetical protein